MGQGGQTDGQNDLIFFRRRVRIYQAVTLFYSSRHS